MPVEIRLFGRPAAFDGERWHDVGQSLDDAVLCYLALTDGWFSRALLSGRFWPDSDEAAARANLRWRLHRLRSRPYLGDLETTREAVRWPVQTDLARFWRAHEAGAWDEVIELVQAPLLGDVRFECSPAVDAEFARVREQVHRAWREAALRRAEQDRDARRHGAAAALLRGVLAADLLDEEVLQAYLHAAYCEGQREQALRLYTAFEAQLLEEFGLAPLAETRALVSTIKEADALLGSALEPAQPTAASRSPSTPAVASAHAGQALGGDLPVFLTPFLGRLEEHERLLRLLGNEHERVVTLLGPGGVGKTRLAVEVARELAPRYRDGIAFVDLAPLDDPKRLAAAVLDAIAPDGRVDHDSEAQLIAILRERELLLVLDTFEQAIAGTSLVQRIATTAPNVRLLITSRVRLGVPGERTFELDGLDCPGDDVSSDEAGAYPAVELFETVAARSLDGFVATDRDRRAMQRVCALVGGLPLAIELAATWVRVMECEAIAEELATSAELLTTAGGHAVEHRHTSFEQVFDTSWKLLKAADREVIAALAVFRGGFTRDTAFEVAGAGLRHLRSLIDASLVERFGSRYVLLDVIQRLAEERLEASGLADAVRARHAQAFARLLDTDASAFDGPGHASVMALVSPESDNVRAAWRHAALRRDVDLLTRMARGLASVWDVRGRYEEAAQLFAEAAEGLSAAGSDEAALASARMRLHESWFRVYLGQYDLVDRLLAGSGERFERVGDSSAAGTSALVTAQSAQARGELEQARTRLEQARAAFEQAGDRAGLAQCDNAMGQFEEARGAIGSAREYYRRSLHERERLGASRGLITVLNDLAALELDLGRLEEAEHYLGRAMSLSRLGFDAWGCAWTEHHLGQLAWARGQHDAARSSFERALRGLDALGHHYATTLTRERLGELLLARAADEGTDQLRRGLRTALVIRATPRVLQLVAWLAYLRAKVDLEAGAAALGCALRAAGDLHRPRALSQRLLASLAASRGERVVALAEAGAGLELRSEAEALCRWAESAALPPQVEVSPGAHLPGADMPGG